MTIGQIRKLIVHVLGIIATMVASGIIAGQGAVIATAVIGVFSAVGLYVVPNEPKP